MASEALELARKSEFDLVLSDVNMPVMDGIELIRALRAESSYRHTPILMLTTEGSRRPQARRQGGRRDRLDRQALRSRRSSSPPCIAC